jgi:hypothetical protein
VQLTRNALAALVGQPECRRRLPARAFRCKAAVPPPALPADLLGRRADIAAARWRVEAATQDVASAKAQFYPNINLSAFAGLSSIGLGRLLDAGSRQWGVGPALRLPIFDAGRLRANLRGKTADLDAAVESYNGAVLDAVRDVADQVASCKSITRQQAEQREAAGRRRKRLRHRRAALPRRPGHLPERAHRRDQVLASAAWRSTCRPAPWTRKCLMRALGGGYSPDADHRWRLATNRRSTRINRTRTRIMNESTTRHRPNAAAAAIHPRKPKRCWPRWPPSSSSAASAGAPTNILVASHYETTDNAYVQGNVIQITPQIGGTVLAIHADDTDFVKAGQPLVQLDPADAKVALDQAEAALAQAVRQVRTLYANNGSLAAQIACARPTSAKAQSDVARANDDLNRRPALTGNGAVSKEELNHAQSQLAPPERAGRRAGRRGRRARAARQQPGPDRRHQRRAAPQRAGRRRQGARSLAGARSAPRCRRRSTATSPSARCSSASAWPPARR